MFKIKEKFFIALYRMIDIFIVGLSFVIAFHMRRNISFPSFEPFHEPFGNYFWHFLVLLFIWWHLLYLNKVYIPYRGTIDKKISWAIIKTNFQGLLLIGFILFFLQEYWIHRTLIIIFILICCLLLISEKYLLSFFLRRIKKLNKNIINAVIIGTGHKAKQVLHLLKTHEAGFQVIGFLDNNPAMIGKKLNDIPIIGLSKDLKNILHHYVVDEVFISLSMKHSEEIKKMIAECEQLGVNARIMAQIYKTYKASVYIDELFGLPFITFTTQPLKVYQLYFKGITDVMIAFILTICLFPLFLIIAILIKLDSKGPVFFKQERAGLNGRRFIMYKFRSMVENAESQKSNLNNLNEMNGPVFKIKNDPRTTRIGQFLRRISFDELPQLLNVLKLDMSLVGPRPLPIDEANRITGAARRRLSMKPGITGLWQVRGRNEIDFDKWMEFDLEYIDYWSLFLDGKILLKTLIAWLSRKGAY